MEYLTDVVARGTITPVRFSLASRAAVVLEISERMLGASPTIREGTTRL